MYKIGDKIVYPNQGVGLIANIEEKHILKKKEKYYILKFFHTTMTMMIPVAQSIKLGLRKISSYHEIKKALMILQSEPDNIESKWKVRYSKNQDKLKQGLFFGLAEVVRNLFIRNTIKELSNSEKKLFDNALKLMISEISISQKLEKNQVKNIIYQNLQKCIA